MEKRIGGFEQRDRAVKTDERAAEILEVLGFLSCIKYNKGERDRARRGAHLESAEDVGGDGGKRSSGTGAAWGDVGFEGVK